jgi:hypothetical protein
VTRTPLRFAENGTLALDVRESRPSLEAAPHALHHTFVNLLARTTCAWMCCSVC